LTALSFRQKLELKPYVFKISVAAPMNYFRQLFVIRSIWQHGTNKNKNIGLRGVAQIEIFDRPA